jgi:hypothetical protein
MKGSNFLMGQKPGRYNSFMSHLSPSPDTKDEFLKSAYEFADVNHHFSSKDSMPKPRFNHNLLLPTKNGREFKKLLEGGKHKFSEMFKNRHKLDDINFKPVIKTYVASPFVDTMAKETRYNLFETKMKEQRSSSTKFEPKQTRNNFIQRQSKPQKTFERTSLRNQKSPINLLSPKKTESKTIVNTSRPIKIKSVIKPTMRRSRGATFVDKVSFSKTLRKIDTSDVTYKKSTLPEVKYSYANTKYTNKPSIARDAMQIAENKINIDNKKSYTNMPKLNKIKSLESINQRSDQNLIK